MFSKQPLWLKVYYPFAFGFIGYFAYRGYHDYKQHQMHNKTRGCVKQFLSKSNFEIPKEFSRYTTLSNAVFNRNFHDDEEVKTLVVEDEKQCDELCKRIQEESNVITVNWPKEQSLATAILTALCGKDRSDYDYVDEHRKWDLISMAFVEYEIMDNFGGSNNFEKTLEKVKKVAEKFDIDIAKFDKENKNNSDYDSIRKKFVEDFNKKHIFDILQSHKVDLVINCGNNTLNILFDHYGLNRVKPCSRIYLVTSNKLNMFSEIGTRLIKFDKDEINLKN